MAVAAAPSFPSGAASTAPSDLIWSPNGYYRRHRRHLLLATRRVDPPPQTKILAWLRDHLHPGIPHWYYNVVLGHDIHVSTRGELYARVHHVEGWTEDLGRVSAGKVTTAFRDFESACLVADQASYGDFKYHDVGLGTTAEANTQTALVSPTGIARVSGTQTNPSAFTYQTVAVTTADTTEVWAEHSLNNAATGGVMMDRSVLSPTISVQPGDTVEWTYILTKSAEP